MGKNINHVSEQSAEKKFGPKKEQVIECLKKTAQSGN
jgi:hypothetical protein